ncbi:MAG: site-specific integrase, partial [Ferruginibacter sp.]
MILTHLQLIQAFLDHLKFQKRYSQNTVIVYKDDLLAFFEYLEFQYPETPIAEIRPAFIRSWLAKLRESGKGIKELGNKSERKSAKRSTSTLPATEPLDSKSINRNISSLKSFFKYQLKQGTLPTSPMATIISPKVKKRLPQFVAEEGISTLFNYVDFPENWEGRTHLLLLQLLYNTGMRRAELISLKEAHIDKGNCNIKVLGKGNKERILPVKRQLMEMVLQYMELKRVEFEQFNGEFLLINKKG